MPNEKTSDSTAQQPSVASQPTTSSTSVVGSKFWLLFILAISNFLASWTLSGFNIDGTSIAIDVVTLIIFWISLGAGQSVLVFFGEVILPFTLLNFDALPVVSFILTHAPIWALFVAIDKVVSDPESKPAKVFAGLALVALLVFAAPSILNANVRTQYTSFNSQEIQEFREAVGATWTNTIDAIKTQGKLLMCNFDVDSKSCKDSVVGETQKDAVLLASEISTIDSGLSFSVSDFLQDGRLSDDQVGVDVTFTNKLPTPARFVFSCGLDRRNAGTTQPSEITILPGTQNQQVSVICSQLNVSQRGSMNFYFNATAVDVVSRGERTILVMDNGVRETILNTAQGSNEKDKWLNAPALYSDKIQQYISSLNAVVGSSDAIQPIIKVAGVGSITSKSPLVYGVTPELQIPFGLYIKNNGRGRITTVKSMEFTLPDLFAFDTPNCGVTETWLKTTPWRTYIGDTYAKRFCQINPKSQREYPNEIDPVLLGVTIVYDYSISRSKEVVIPERGSA